MRRTKRSSACVTVKVTHFDRSMSPQNTAGRPKAGSFAASRSQSDQALLRRCTGGGGGGESIVPTVESAVIEPRVTITKSPSSNAMSAGAPARVARMRRTAWRPSATASKSRSVTCKPTSNCTPRCSSQRTIGRTIESWPL